MSEPMTEANKDRPLRTGESEVMMEDKAFGGWHRVVGHFHGGAHFKANWTSRAYVSWQALILDYPQFRRKNPAEYSQPKPQE